VKAQPLTALISLLTVLIAAPAPAQQAVDGPRCVVFAVQDLSAGEDTRDYERTITEAVSAAASARGLVVLAEADWKAAAEAHSLSTDRPDTQTSIEIARIAGADYAITGAFTVQNEEIYYTIQCWDASTGALATAIQDTTSFNLALFSALSLSLSDELLPAVKTGQPVTPRVTFTSPDEDMEVYLSGDVRIGRITDGKVTWPIGEVAPGARVTVEKRKKGYHTARQAVALQTTKDIPLSPLAPEHRSAAALDLSVGQLLGLGGSVRGYLSPDWAFVSLGNYFWAQPPLVFAQRLVFHDDVSIGFGVYLLLPPGSPVRLAVSAGAGIIITKPTVAGSAFYTDPYLDIGSLWVEAGFPRTTLYLRSNFRYALGVGPHLLDQGWLLQNGPSVTLGVLFR
jgi:hypothetical protein